MAGDRANLSNLLLLLLALLDLHIDNAMMAKTNYGIHFFMAIELTYIVNSQVIVSWKVTYADNMINEFLISYYFYNFEKL